MRRRRFEVPFSQLWKRVLEQKDANALWKQLKRLISLLLILLILGLVLFAALDPTLGAVDRKARSVVILLDASASMKAMDGDDGRQASRASTPRRSRPSALIDSMGGGDVAMIMKVDGQATPMSRFSSDGPMLDKIIDGIQASDTPADLPRALGAAADALRDRHEPADRADLRRRVPRAAARPRAWAKPPRRRRRPTARSAGARRKNLAAVDLSSIDVRYLPVGQRSDNVGIIAFNVRRYIANKAAYEVYIEIQNFGSEPAHRQLTLYNGDDRRRRPDASTSRPASASARSTPKLPGERRQQAARVAAPGRRRRRLAIRSRSTTRRTRCCPRARSRRS